MSTRFSSSFGFRFRLRPASSDSLYEQSTPQGLFVCSVPGFDGALL